MAIHPFVRERQEQRLQLQEVRIGAGLDGEIDEAPGRSHGTVIALDAEAQDLAGIDAAHGPAGGVFHPGFRLPRPTRR